MRGCVHPSDADDADNASTEPDVDPLFVESVMAEREARLYGVSGGVLLTTYNKRNRAGRTVYTSLKCVLCGCHDNGRALPCDCDSTRLTCCRCYCRRRCYCLLLMMSSIETV